MNAFKAGDLVRITGELFTRNLKAGETVRLANYDPADGAWLARSLTGTGWIWPGEFEAIEPTTAVTVDPENADDMTRLSQIWHSITSADLEDDMRLSLDGWRLRATLRAFAKGTES